MDEEVRKENIGQRQKKSAKIKVKNKKSSGKVDKFHRERKGSTKTDTDTHIYSPNINENEISTADSQGQDVQNDYIVTQRCKHFIRQSWINLKDIIDVQTLILRLREEGWIKPDDFRGASNNSRIIEVERLLIYIVNRIDNSKDIKKFQGFVGGDEITLILKGKRTSLSHKHTKTLSEDQDNTEVYKLILQNKRELLECILQPMHVMEIKDNFLQCAIIDFSDNEQIFNDGEIHNLDSKASVRLVFDKAIEKVKCGSYFCLLQSLKDCQKKHRSGRLSSILDEFDELEVENKKLVKNFDLELSFKGESEKDERKVWKHIMSGPVPADVHVTIRDELNSEFNGISLGSLVIHLRTLDGHFVEKLRKSVQNKTFGRIIESFFHDIEVKKMLHIGKNYLMVKCVEVPVEVENQDSTQVPLISEQSGEQNVIFQAECELTVDNTDSHGVSVFVGQTGEQNVVIQKKKEKAEKSTDCHTTEQMMDSILGNRYFLVRELDNKLILKAFEKKGKPLNMVGIDEDDRYKVANHIIDEIARNNFQNIFQEIVTEKNLTYIHKRLITYERVHKTETKHLRQILINKIEVLKKVDLDLVRSTFIERNVFKEELFDNIEKKHGNNREACMVEMLTEIINARTDAGILTFVDALFSIHLECLAEDILQACIRQETTVDEDSNGTTSQLIRTKKRLRPSYSVTDTCKESEWDVCLASSIKQVRIEDSRVDDSSELEPIIMKLCVTEDEHCTSDINCEHVRKQDQDFDLVQTYSMVSSPDLSICADQESVRKQDQDIDCLEAYSMVSSPDSGICSDQEDMKIQDQDFDCVKANFIVSSHESDQCAEHVYYREILTKSTNDLKYCNLDSTSKKERWENMSIESEPVALQYSTRLDKNKFTKEEYRPTIWSMPVFENRMTGYSKDSSIQDEIMTTTSTNPKFKDDVRQPLIKRTPSPVDQSFRDDVKAWKKIRSETIPRLERLERELRSANEKIKTARTLRNWTIGLSVLGGLLFAPFTGGGSLAAAAAVAGGTTGVLYFIEMYIEKDVLETTQEGINKDKTETLRLRTRITSYQGGHKRTEEFVHDLGGIAFEAIFLLSQDSLVAFIASFVDNNSMSLLIAIQKVIDLRKQLERELRRVEEVEGRFY